MAEYVMYIAAIKLPPGKLAAQVGHGVLGLYRKLRMTLDRELIEVLDSWLNEDGRGDRGVQAKVVLQIENDAQVEQLISYCDKQGIPWYTVRDAGRTVVSPGTLTTIAWGPVSRSEQGPWVDMRLY